MLRCIPESYMLLTKVARKDTQRREAPHQGSQGFGGRGAITKQLPGQQYRGNASSRAYECVVS